MTPWFWKPFYSLPGTLALGLIIPGIVALVIGFFVFRSRVRGVFFAVLTQAVTLAAWLVFCMNEMKLCGTNGFTGFDRLAGFELSDSNTRLGLYVISLASLALVYWLCSLIIRSRLGRVLVAIRDNETRLRFAGYKPHLFKMFIFSVSAMIAGLGGMLYAPQMGIFTPTSMETRASILVVVWVAVGGRGTLGGAIAGTLLVNLLYNLLTSRQEFFWFLRDYLTPTTYEKLVWSPNYWPFVLGGLFIIVVLYMPDGIANIWRAWTTPKENEVVS
jgi:urea transport system permease protein